MTNQEMTNQEMTKEKFVDKYIHSELESLLFNKLANILSNKDLKNDTFDKQRRIEKLVNVYLLKKEEHIYELNPLWDNKLNSVFQKELSIFTSLYNDRINIDIKKNLFKGTNLNKFITGPEMFKIILFTLLIEGSFTGEESELGLVKKSSLLAKSLKMLRNILEIKISSYYFILFMNNKKKPILNFKWDLNKYQTHINTNKELFYWKKELNSLFFNEPSKITILKTQFKAYISKHNLIINRFLYKLLFFSIEILFDSHILKKYIIRRRKFTYDYINIFNLEKFSKLKIICYLNNQIPMIVPPLDWDSNGKHGGFLLNKNKDEYKLVKGLCEGYSKCNLSKSFISTINLIQHKKYRINKSFLSYIKTDLFKLDFNINTLDDIYKIYINYINSVKEYKIILGKNNINSDVFLLYNESKNSLYSTKKYKESTKDERKNLISKLRLKYNLTSDLIDMYVKQLHLESDFIKAINLYKNHQFIVNFATVYKHQDLYMVNSSDFRGRFYPVGRGIHRASGLYKYLLESEEDFSPITNLPLLKEGISLCFKDFVMFEVSQLHDWFDRHINNYINNKNINLLIEWIDSFINRIDNTQKKPTNDDTINHFESLVLDSKDKSLFLFYLREYFYYSKDNKYITNWTYDIDQCSSGPMIYSLLSNDRNMARLTNVYNTGNIKYDLYNSFINNFKCSLQSKQDDSIYYKYLYKNFDTFFNRKFSKLLIMPTFYNMGKQGRNDLLGRTFCKANDEFLNLHLKQLITVSEDLIYNILLEKYKETIDYQNNLVNICEYIYKHNEPIRIKTLDGSVIKYSYLEEKRYYGKLYKGNTTLTYRIYVPSEYAEHTWLSKRHYLTFPPNYIHSIDGALCRIICKVFYLKYNKIIEPLHDSFRITNNLIPYLNNVIKYVYIFYFFNELFHKNKIGFSTDNNTIIYNSINYKKYAKYFSVDIKDILNFTFITQISLNEDLDTEINNYIKNNNMRYLKKTDEDLRKILNSKFMFYY